MRRRGDGGIKVCSGVLQAMTRTSRDIRSSEGAFQVWER